MGEKKTDNEFERNEIVREFIDDFAEQIKRLAYTYVKNWAVADDITQEVFISCFKNIEHFRGESSYKTWLFKITVNRCKDYLKSKWFRSMVPFRGDEKVEVAAGLDEILVQKSEGEEISQKVLSLSVKYREVIILFYYEDLGLQEIEELTGIKTETVKTRLRRAKLQLRELYKEVE
ncbi:sigma-70 family RNA polymerase sigma factor [Alkalihalobacillus hwajinpoensis]|uniref:sigma-70 family RNA polymerase sigma factor n=1 Tax=Guptibacillus hwajinpoensis TaxID=208199 RepID=UPI0018845896|nr:sigma-70 family RNA polymerase sigma factor [Pseudalkalibacillus hwajinpoensis]MBF0705430.1 sigma-70 family RNA polymerase sigma factor [Pseudalkalibacillus hwajinpoensis]